MNEQHDSGPVDILCVAAHPDDAELYAGGTLIRTIDNGGSVAICDLTKGEMASRGTVETRRAETETACKILGVPFETHRVNLGLPDGRLTDSNEAIEKLVAVIRRFAPDILLVPSPEDRHPDHGAANRIGRRAWYLAGLVNFESDHPDENPAHRPRLLLEFDHVRESEPDVVVDISAQYERKVRAIEAYGTQFGTDTDDTESVATLIADPSFARGMTARMQRLGFQIGCAYGEGFSLVGSPVPLNDLRDLLGVAGNKGRPV